MNPILMTDGYKTSHHKLYPEGTSLVYSNFTPRSVRLMPEQAKDIVVFGIQYTIKYIKDLWDREFFDKPKDFICGQAKDYLSSYLGMDYDISHFEKLHDLGYLPIHIKSLPEGMISTERVPILTITNTNPDFYWLPNFLETLISSLLWKPLHSASIAYAFKKMLTIYAEETDKDNLQFVDYQGHDFSFRGLQHPESAISSGLGFLTSFKGTDTIPSLQAAYEYYREQNAGFSVPASEHAVVTAFGKEDEISSFERIMTQFPTGIVSMVSDSFDLWKVCTEYLPALKEQILERDGKLVIRPDSGDPVDIICGLYILKFDTLEDAIGSFEDLLGGNQVHGEQEFTCDEEMTVQVGDKYYILKADNVDWNRYDKQYYFVEDYNISSEEVIAKPCNKGVIELLWDVFGGTVNEQGYKVLDPHIGAILGDGVTLDRCEQICERLKAKGFASTNLVFGIGSYSMGYATRDQQGCAIKATYVELIHETEVDLGRQGSGIGHRTEPREIFKAPVTDSGEKKSARGLLQVYETSTGYKLKERCTWEEERQGALRTVFINGQLIRETSLQEIRDRLKASVENSVKKTKDLAEISA